MQTQSRTIRRLLDQRHLSTAYSAAFICSLGGGGAWCREARIVVALAAQRNIRLDEDQLVISDVRDLQALRFALLMASSDA